MTGGFWNGTQNIRSYLTLHVPLRGSPDLTEVSGTGNRGGGAWSGTYQTSTGACSVASTMDNNTVYLSRSGFSGGSDMKGVNHLHQNWESWFSSEL
jgi:hypothetical protein